jgi:alanine-glyoxylate transaminase/serine-glyoxylate transaminase/serine-pyruvate transaminase
MVHCETSTCILNPVEQISVICQENNALLMVDAISSLGAANLPVDDWQIDLCVAGTQKALGCPPGLGLVSVSERAWSMMDEHNPLGWYSNLQIWRKYADDWGHFFPHPVTQNSGLFKALHWSTRQLLDQGLPSVFQRHLIYRDQLRNKVRDLGFDLLIGDDDASPSATAIVLDDRITPLSLIGKMQQQHGILIGGGLGTLADRVVRIGHMGPQAKPERMDPLLKALTDMLLG